MYPGGKVKIAVPLEGGKQWVGEYDPEEKIEKLVKDFKEQTKAEIPDHVMMIWKKNKETLNLNDPVKTLLPKKSPTITLDYDYEQKGIDLPNVISNSPDLIGKPFYNPFEVEVFNKNNGNLKRLNLNLNDVKNTEIENYNAYSAYCNGNNHLYISGGQNEKKVILGQFWDIDLEKETIEKFPQGIEPKKNHSMIFIPDKYVFIVGGNNKKTFYYDIENKEIVNWANLNQERIEPALVIARNDLYCFDNLNINSNKTLTFEKTNLINSPKWDLITPKIDPSNPDNSFNQKFFGAVKVDNDTIIFLGGDMNESKYSDTNYFYKIPDETIYKSEVPFIQKNLSEKNFVDIDNKNKLVLPNYNKNCPEIFLFNKEKYNLHSIIFQIEKPPEKVVLKNVKKKINYSFDYNMPVRVNLDDIQYENNEDKKLENTPEKPEIKETDVQLNKNQIDVEVNEKPVDINLNRKPVNLSKNKEEDNLEVKSIKNEGEELNNKIEPKINLQNKVLNSDMNINVPHKEDDIEYYFDPIDKTKKKKSPDKKIVQSEIHTIHRNYDGQLLRSSLISGNKQIGLKSTHLPKVEGKNSNFKKSKIGVAGDFDSKNVNIHQSVNVGISGKKAGSKIISQ